MNTEEPDQNKQSLSPKQSNPWKVLSVVFGVLVLGIIVAYVWNFEIIRSTQECPRGLLPLCTADLREMCSPDGKERKTVPSICSCGILDARTLMSQGWRDCQ